MAQQRTVLANVAPPTDWARRPRRGNRSPATRDGPRRAGPLGPPTGRRARLAPRRCATVPPRRRCAGAGSPGRARPLGAGRVGPSPPPRHRAAGRRRSSSQRPIGVGGDVRRPASSGGGDRRGAKVGRPSLRGGGRAARQARTRPAPRARTAAERWTRARPAKPRRAQRPARRAPGGARVAAAATIAAASAEPKPTAARRRVHDVPGEHRGGPVAGHRAQRRGAFAQLTVVGPRGVDGRLAAARGVDGGARHVEDVERPRRVASPHELQPEAGQMVSQAELVDGAESPRAGHRASEARRASRRRGSATRWAAPHGRAGAGRPRRCCGGRTRRRRPR